MSTENSPRLLIVSCRYPKLLSVNKQRPRAMSQLFQLRRKKKPAGEGEQCRNLSEV